MTERDLLELRIEMTDKIELSGKVEMTGICWVCGGETKQHYSAAHSGGFYLYSQCQNDNCRQFETEFIGRDE